jgi:hypothetical protein
MRETRSSGSVEGVVGNHDSYSDSPDSKCDRPHGSKLGFDHFGKVGEDWKHSA